jgi:hypothetical protein
MDEFESPSDGLGVRRSAVVLLAEMSIVATMDTLNPIPRIRQ